MADEKHNAKVVKQLWDGIETVQKESVSREDLKKALDQYHERLKQDLSIMSSRIEAVQKDHERVLEIVNRAAERAGKAMDQGNRMNEFLGSNLQEMHSHMKNLRGECKHLFQQWNAVLKNIGVRLKLVPQHFEVIEYDPEEDNEIKRPEPEIGEG